MPRSGSRVRVSFPAPVFSKAPTCSGLCRFMQRRSRSGAAQKRDRRRCFGYSQAAPFCYDSLLRCGNSSVGRARPCQGRGREFESRFPLQFSAKPRLVRGFVVSCRGGADPGQRKNGIGGGVLAIHKPLPSAMIRCSDAGIAQLVEHDLAKVGVASSSLVSRSSFQQSLGSPGFCFLEATCDHYGRDAPSNGQVAEWSCSGLQSRVRRFDSDLGLHCEQRLRRLRAPFSLAWLECRRGSQRVPPVVAT